MDPELPKRIFRPGYEPQIVKVNNSCKMSLMKLLQKAMPSEFDKVKRDPVFAKILAIHDNCLGFSGRLVHSFMCRQIATAKLHELWFIFARRPIRFSMQEYHVVTGLKCKYDEDCDCDFEDWVDDDSYWSRLLKTGKKINIKMIKNKKFLARTRKWTPKDRMRLIFLCVIAGLVMARDDKVYIPHSYVKLVMDLGKLGKYPWGIDSFDLLIESITNSKKKLTRKKSYVLDGFSYALQIWIMEAIPDIGVLLGRKLRDGAVEHPRCSNWTGAARVSYEDIIQLETTFGSKGTFYPYISMTGNMDVFDSIDFVRGDEMTDDGVDEINRKIRTGFEWTGHIWDADETWLGNKSSETQDEVNSEEEPDIGDEVDDVDDVDDIGTPDAEDTHVSGIIRNKKRLPDHGAESRKQKLLCQRSASASVSLDENMKLFIQGVLEGSLASMEDRLGKKIDRLETHVTELRNEVSLLSFHRNSGEPGNSSNPTRPESSTAKELQKQGKEDNVVAGKQNVSFDTLYEVHLSQASDIDPELSTQEFLRKTMGSLSQDSFVAGFDQTQRSQAHDATEWLTPKTSFKPMDTKVCDLLSKPSLISNERHERRKKEADYPLVFFTEEAFEQVHNWSSTHTELQIGQSVLDEEMATRIIGPNQWLHNKDIDAVMYMLQENTSLGRWKAKRIAFMTCSFSNLIKGAYNKYIMNKRKFKLDEILLDYGNGELPAHGRTRKMWDLDVDRIYIPVFVNGNHWISLCVSFIHRRIEVFDCSGKKNTKEVEAFAVLIPRIVREVQSPSTKKHLNITHYSVSYVPMQPGLNRSHCDCGVYALKFIECHVLGLDLTVMDDENIKEARFKIAIDLWKAANDPVFIERMSKYEPPKARISEVVEIK